MPHDKPNHEYDPAGLYVVLALTTDPGTALREALAVALGRDAAEAPEALLDAVRDAVHSARVPPGELEELRLQLQLCSLAALTGSDVAHVERGERGWSPAYDEVRELRRKYQAIAELHDSLPWPVITAYDFWASIRKALNPR